MWVQVRQRSCMRFILKNISLACDILHYVLDVLSLCHPQAITEHKYSIISLLLISRSFRVSASLPTVWNSFTSYKPSWWWGCGAAVCGRTGCALWFEVEMSSRAVTAGERLMFLKIYNSITKKNVDLFNSCDRKCSDDFLFVCLFPSLFHMTS